MEPTSLQTEADAAAAARVLAVELDGKVVARCADEACHVCGPVLEAAA